MPIATPDGPSSEVKKPIVSVVLFGSVRTEYKTSFFSESSL